MNHLLKKPSPAAPVTAVLPHLFKLYGHSHHRHAVEGSLVHAVHAAVRHERACVFVAQHILHTTAAGTEVSPVSTTHITAWTTQLSWPAGHAASRRRTNTLGAPAVGNLVQLPQSAAGWRSHRRGQCLHTRPLLGAWWRSITAKAGLVSNL